jgi:hypothetical protein
VNGVHAILIDGFRRHVEIARQSPGYLRDGGCGPARVSRSPASPSATSSFHFFCLCSQESPAKSHIVREIQIFFDELRITAESVMF